MKPKPPQCTTCPFASRGLGYAAPPHLPLAGHTDLLVIGQGPGRVEATTGTPFHPEAPSGRKLRQQLTRAGWSVDRVLFDNVTRCWIRTGKADVAPVAAIQECQRRHWGAVAEAAIALPIPLVAVGTPAQRYLIAPWASIRSSGAIYERNLPNVQLDPEDPPQVPPGHPAQVPEAPHP